MTTDLMEVDANGDGTLVTKYAEENAVDTIMETLKEIAKATTSLDSRHVWRGLKDLSTIRKNSLNQESLATLVNILYPDSSAFKIPLLKYINDNHKSNVPNSEKLRAQYPAAFYKITPQKTIEVSPELNSFFHLLVQLYLLDSKKFTELETFNSKIVIPTILEVYNHRSLDLISAKLWFYIILGYESVGDVANAGIRTVMIKSLKTASLKHDNETRAMLINLILRNYLADGDVNSADDFVRKVEFPTTNVSNPLEARYYFYMSKINAIQLDYTTANDFIITAIRKAPHTPNSLGFLQQANKLHCVIQLLMGDIPELSFFHQTDMQQSLYPYYHLTNTVKLGDLKKFSYIISRFKPQLVHDSNYQLCVRLRSNVIKTGIRMISLTYKKISLKDICLKLRLDSEQAAEYMVSRSIRDGVIEANINHEKGYIETSELLNVYDTNNPQKTFDARIQFVTQLHNESVMAMRYPEDSKKVKNATQNNDADSIDYLDDISDFSDIDDLGFL
ncbi:similar to Saccharomyces cerevisiae YER021W RPN3 Essential, non-ATPase regulatory subunit of the 26S proteasome lid, similar to the p58 subunit of the human 26S proteasome [Maudiozyma saulgeensis]|uniref:Similar to Saccharomyces cerevisiae YER021W RPN3 Essential, non-ATPase regulatory subunit of the 26S proteasome lid, similar to the p58 subunit of the human 26S proteasome n=1 Tax=Maudiozyma saulgeensis TaxID=1789683 RepID=A0A1X7R6C2_9SACH|nr:similar to Saccharomyces cerevisiae YER021W RPN3 Essential, non-ATPase regulatory subunit of the 26S proteasome lid, similar to the p58 subunit of the human 26S proteasome [Kazachstania saulgeensis]